MSQFNYFQDINKPLNLDGELKNNIKPRWQRKMENSMNNSSMMNQSKLSVSYNNSYAALGNTTSQTNNINKTPNKTRGENAAKNDKKSPGIFQRFFPSHSPLMHFYIILYSDYIFLYLFNEK